MSRAAAFLFVLLLSPVFCIATIDDEDLIDMRGDVNNDKSVNHADIIYLSSYLYSGGAAPPCMNQADVNDDGYVNGSDPVYLGNYLYADGPAPPAPGTYNPYCDRDPTSPHLGCRSYSCP